VGHDAHRTACGVGGLGHRVECAVATDGDHGRAGGTRLRCSLLRHAGQLGRAAEQQVPSPSTGKQRGFDDPALGFGVLAARRRIDDELQR